MLNDIKLRGMAIVQITHDLESALANSDEILVLERGSVAAVGNPEEVAEHLAAHNVKGLVLPPTARFAIGLRKRGIRVPLTGGLHDVIGALGLRIQGG
jgi:ABC-type sulfate/molybdate transport systems ATPase subunit